MCELTAHAYEADTHDVLSPSEIAAVPIRRTWYGIVGTADSVLNPEHLTESHELAKARAIVANHDYPLSGPWHVVALTENLRVTP